jgi:hypothetical protein
MPVIYALIIFVFLIVALSALRQRLVYELSGTSLLLFDSTRPGIVLYSLIFLPGTIIHELSHWIVAEILQVKTGEITIFPDLDIGETGSQRLGSVATSRSDPIRGFFIGLAPFVTGLAILIVLSKLLSTGWSGTFPWWQLVLIIYGIMVIGNTMMISREDRRTWPFVVILFLFIIVILAKYYPAVLSDHDTFYLGILSPLNSVLGVTAVINLVMIGGSYGLRRLIEKMTKRRIAHK